MLLIRHHVMFVLIFSCIHHGIMTYQVLSSVHDDPARFSLFKQKLPVSRIKTFSTRTLAYQCPPIGTLVSSINDFGSDLTRRLVGEGNLFISPFGIYMALAMLYTGARQETATQMANVMNLDRLNMTRQDLLDSFRNITESFFVTNRSYSLEMASAIFVDKKFPVTDEYVQEMETIFCSMAGSLDFAGNPIEAKIIINEWVAENTNDKISQFLLEPMDTATVLALINAVYFKGTWKNTFDKDFTHDKIFFKNNGEKKKVKFMVKEGEKFPVFFDRQSRYKYLEMPYVGDDVVMLFALPRKKDQYPDLNMTSHNLCHVFGSLRKKRIVVKIPKFNLNYERELKETLMSMGMVDVFSENANLTGIAKEPISLSSVSHNAVIDVDEEGSEAAAVTGVFLINRSGHYSKFDADHPFLFYIVDKRYGIILFSGRMMDP